MPNNKNQKTNKKQTQKGPNFKLVASECFDFLKFEN
jgi:hypothetical protein